MFGLMGVARLAGQPGGAFSPLSLFANSEQGVWYDPSDFSSMFQDSTGTTPVTAVEQPVGLILDKRLGMALGPELVTNGDFSDGTTGFTEFSGSTMAVSGGVLRCTRTSTSGDSGIQFDVPGLVAGRTYWIEFDVVAFSGVSGASIAYLPPLDYNTTGTGHKKALFTFAGGSTNILCRTTGAGPAGSYIEYDNISVREIAGNHATQPTAAARPVVSAPNYLAIDGVDDRLDISSLSLIDGMDCFIAVNTNSGVTSQALFTLDVGYSAYFGIWSPGSYAGTYDGAVGTPEVAVDGTVLPSALRNDLYGALTVGDWHILEYRGLDLSTWTTMLLFGGGNIPFSGDVGGIVLCPSQDEATRAKVRQYLGNKVGLSL